MNARPLGYEHRTARFNPDRFRTALNEPRHQQPAGWHLNMPTVPSVEAAKQLARRA